MLNNLVDYVSNGILNATNTFFRVDILLDKVIKVSDNLIKIKKLERRGSILDNLLSHIDFSEERSEYLSKLVNWYPAGFTNLISKDTINNQVNRINDYFLKKKEAGYTLSKELKESIIIHTQTMIKLIDVNEIDIKTYNLNEQNEESSFSPTNLVQSDVQFVDAFSDFMTFAENKFFIENKILNKEYYKSLLPHSENHISPILRT